MKAFRLYNGIIQEIDVDVGLDGLPILPPNTTVDPRPDEIPNHYLTIEGNVWLQVEIPAPTLEQERQNKLIQFAKYREQYMDQPVTVNDVLFDADSTARERLTQALVMNQVFSYLPPVWITHGNQSYPIAVIGDLAAIAQAVQTAFASRFYEMTSLRDSINAATTVEQINAITIPANVG